MTLGANSSNGYISDQNLSKSAGGIYLGSGSGMPSNHHARDSSLMNGGMGPGIDYGTSSMQQISYYDYLSRDEDDMSPQMDEEE